MADRSASPDYTGAPYSENCEVSRYLEHASDGKCSDLIDEKIAKSTHLEYDGHHDNFSATEGRDVPRSGVRRRNVPTGVLANSENPPCERIRPKGRTAWLRARELLGRQMPQESSQKYNSSLDGNGESTIRLEQIAETICKEQCCQRNLAVKALPEGAPEHNTVLLVTRSFEINPTVRENWSLLREAVFSGNIKDTKEDENEKSGLRRLSLVPRQRVADKMEISSRQGRGGWPKIRAIIGKKVLRRSSKSEVLDDGGSLHYVDESDVAAAENISEPAFNTGEVELYTDVDSAVQALPIDIVGEDEVVSVTRSFEYNRTWIDEREVLKRQCKNQEGENVSKQEKDNRNCLQLNPQRNVSSMKDACCQTDFESGKIFEQKVMKQLTCETCGSKLEERKKRKTKNIKGYVPVENGARPCEDQHKGNEHLLEGKGEYNEMRLVAEKFPCKEAVSRLQKERDEETKESLVNSYRERKENPSEVHRSESDVYEVGNSVDFEKDEENNNIFYNIMSEKHESGQNVAKRTSIPEESFLSPTVDNSKTSDRRKWKENPSEFETPGVGKFIATQSVSALEQKEKEGLNAVTRVHNERTVELLKAGLIMRSANVKKESLLEGVRRPCNPVAITAKFVDCKQLSLKHVQIVKAVRSVEAEPWTISYV